MAKGLRVLQVMPRATGGIARHVAQVVEGLDGRDGITVDIAAPPLEVPMPKPVLSVDLPEGAVLGHRRAVGQIRSAVVNGRYQIVHAHGLRAGIDTGRALSGLDVPLVVTIHNVVLAETFGRLRAAVYRRAEDAAVDRADRVIAVSEEIARRFRSRAPGIEVVYAGVGDAPPVRRSRDEVRRELEVDGDLIVTASRLAPQKGLPMMLDAVAALPESVVLAVAGSGPAESMLKSHADRAGVSDRVRWLGHRGDVADLIAAADVFCLSSVWEAVALAVQEAVLLGTPVVATSVGGIPELITDGTSGRLVPPGDAAALAAALAAVLGSPEERARFVENARASYDDRFSAAKMVARLATIYRELSSAA